METVGKAGRAGLLVICLTLAFSSCTNQQAAPNGVAVAVTDTISKSPTREDTSKQRLEFTSMVRAMLEDSNGNLWLGSDRSGVCKINGDSIEYFDTSDGLSHNQIRSIQEHEDGTIWFRTGAGITSYDPKAEPGGNNPLTRYPTNELAIVSGGFEWKKTAADVWVGEGDRSGGIYRYDGQNLEYLSFPVLEQPHESFSIAGPVTGECYGKDNTVWIASYGGVLGYDGSSFKFINRRHFQYHVRSIFEDSKGNLWIGNNGIGVLRYDGDTTINFTKAQGLNHLNGESGGSRGPAGTLNHVFAIEEDKDGNIWFGDRDTGAWRFDGEKMTNYSSLNGVHTGAFVRAIYCDKSGNLWLSEEHGGVYKFNGQDFDQVYY